MVHIPRPERLIRVPPVESVTTCNTAAEVPPESVGLSRRDVDAIWRRTEGLYRSGLYPAVALCLRRRGQVVLDRAIGHVRGNAPGAGPDAHKELATPATRFTLFSVSKAITAMIVHLLDQEGILHIDDPVEEYIPEFGQNGKHWITLRHVLTHRAGIPSLPGEKFDLDILARPDAIIDMLCRTKPTLPPGRRLAYHALTGGYVLGEVVRRATGKDIRTVLRERVLEPLGFDHLNYGVPPAELGTVAENAFTGPPVLPPFSTLLKRALGVSFGDAVRFSNDPRYTTAIVPAGNVIGTANDLCRFFQLLLDGGTLDGVRIFERRTIRRALAEHTYFEIDLTFAVPVRYGLGFVLGGDWLSLYGLHTPRAFGHLGFSNILAYADPEREIGVAILNSGKPFFSPRLTRIYRLVQSIARRCPRVPLED
jgi:CubicO group peptidase (beta-lactamase class C family)